MELSREPRWVGTVWMSVILKRRDDEPQGRESEFPRSGPGGIEPKWLRYSYFTAGSGGAGPTILETSLLLAGEEVVVYKEGQQFRLPPVSNRREVDFGPGVRGGWAASQSLAAHQTNAAASDYVKLPFLLAVRNWAQGPLRLQPAGGCISVQIHEGAGQVGALLVHSMVHAHCLWGKPPSAGCRVKRTLWHRPFLLELGNVARCSAGAPQVDSFFRLLL